MIELACPESCSYLLEARTSAGQREKELRVKESADPRALMLSDRALIALNAIERAIVQAQRGKGTVSFRDLNNADILAAVENSTKNLETEETGLIYEHRTATPRIDELSRGIRDALDGLSKELPPESRPRRSDFIRALNFTRDALQAHMKRPSTGAEGARSYLRFISLFHPWPEDATRPLIV
ncbi:MAG TPA: hypothetical protein VLM38_09425 [Blastocatellia bacterium]|nr:hypothetical protein [Blastocatellia bacterium]